MTLTTLQGGDHASRKRHHLCYKLYPGARHEILNETNREQVHADIFAWLDERA